MEMLCKEQQFKKGSTTLLKKNEELIIGNIKKESWWVKLFFNNYHWGNESENEKLTNEVSDLKRVVEKFISRKENFKDMLGKQRSAFDKKGISYNMISTWEYFKDYVVKASSNSRPPISCNLFGKNGHYKHACPLRKSNWMY